MIYPEKDEHASRKEIQYEEVACMFKRLGNCWSCTSHAVGTNGYPMIKRNNVRYSPQRYIWIQNFGEIPADMQVLHKCNNKLCIRPNHLYLGTAKDNVRDHMAIGGRTGETAGRAKLTNRQAVEIRGKLKNVKHLCAVVEKLARKYKVHKTTIFRIHYGWTYVNA